VVLKLLNQNNMQPQKNQSNLSDLLEQIKDEIGYKINCTRIGVIVSFDPTTQRATVQLVDNLQRQGEKGSVIEYAPEPLIDIPVQINATLQGGLTMPITENDFCIIQFNDRNLTNWKETGLTKEIPLASLRSHSFSDGIAIIGIFPNTAPLQNYNNNATELFFEGTKISLDDKIGLTNTNESLKSCADNLIGNIDSLIGVLENFKVQDQSTGDISIPDGGTVSALNGVKSDLNNVKNQFNNLLK
tara:strand:- start:4703 stop:5434 length:732 start_codon:yes stop_codon:yes gene_type:complete